MPGIGRAVMFRIPHPSVVEEAVRQSIGGGVVLLAAAVLHQRQQ